MLTYREIDYQKDLDQIVGLVQKNLDPEYTEESFRWKHLENPFGKSYGRLALDGDKVVGLRMFMFWEFIWIGGKEKIRAIRPVDTVTDVDYRGKGLFKKLTFDGLEECEGKYDIVFNTPNENSLPGYLKMGWEIMDNCKEYKIGVLNPLSEKAEFSEITLEEINVGNFENGEDYFRTNATSRFLQWRYATDRYRVASFDEQHKNCIIYRIDHIKKLKMLVIVEIFGDINYFSTMINSLAKKTKSFFIYHLDHIALREVSFIAKFNGNKTNVVYRNDRKMLQKKIRTSLGDLEGEL